MTLIRTLRPNVRYAFRKLDGSIGWTPDKERADRFLPQDARVVWRELSDDGMMVTREPEGKV